MDHPMSAGIVRAHPTRMRSSSRLAGGALVVSFVAVAFAALAGCNNDAKTAWSCTQAEVPMGGNTTCTQDGNGDVPTHTMAFSYPCPPGSTNPDCPTTQPTALTSVNYLTDCVYVNDLPYCTLSSTQTAGGVDGNPPVPAGSGSGTGTSGNDTGATGTGTDTSGSDPNGSSMGTDTSGSASGSGTGTGTDTGGNPPGMGKSDSSNGGGNNGKGNGKGNQGNGNGNGGSANGGGGDTNGGGMPTCGGGDGKGGGYSCEKDDNGNKSCSGGASSCAPGTHPSACGACVSDDRDGDCIPPSEGGCWITGGGFIVTNDKDNFGGNAKPMKNGTIDGHWNHVDHATDQHALGRPEYIYCRDVDEPGPGGPGAKKGFNMNQIYFGGHAQWRENGTWSDGYWFDVVAEDHGEAGNLSAGPKSGVADSYHFTLRKIVDPKNLASGTTVYEKRGDLVGGNIQIHPSNGGHPAVQSPLPSWVALED